MQLKSKIILLIFLFVFLTYIKKKKNIKICLCTIGKLENRYIREFIEHYKKYKVDKIFLYDNNDKNDEKFDYVISDYIKNGFVKILNWRGKKKIQKLAYENCYQLNKKIYDFFLFYDIDEFIYLENMNLKFFLSQKKFHKCQAIQLNWVMHTDNNALYFYNDSLFKRFPKKGKSLKDICDVKSIIRGNLTIKINHAHFANPNITCCDGYGKIKKNFTLRKKAYYKKYYIDHFFTKSTEELIIKIKKGSVAKNSSRINYLINSYFQINKVTRDKINYIEKKIFINLSRYKKRNELFNSKNLD